MSVLIWINLRVKFNYSNSKIRGLFMNKVLFDKANYCQLSEIIVFFGSTQKQRPQVLKLNFRDIEVIDYIGENYQWITELSLNHNQLTTL